MLNLYIKKTQHQRGSVFAALFGAVVMVGVLAAGVNTVMRGPVTTMSEVTRRTVAENAMIAASRLSVVMAGTVQPSGGDCDGDGTVEPIPFRDPGTGARPTGGGYLPSTIGAQSMDPWQTEYGYCVWDHGTQRNAAGCGGATQRRLSGAPGAAGAVIAVISAGRDKTFQTACNAFVDANADNIPDTPLVNRPGGSDDILHTYTYAEAMGIGDGLWRLKTGAPTVAEIDRSLEVKDAGGAVTAAIDRTSGIGNFVGVTTNMLTPRSGTGIEVAGGLKLGTDTAACPGPANAKVGTLRRNAGVAEICTAAGWNPLGGGGSDNLGNHTATQNILLGNFRITGLGAPLSASDAATRSFVEAGDNNRVSRFGDSMAGFLEVPIPTAGAHAANMSYVVLQTGERILRTGDTMTGPLTVPTPTAAGHATTKAYVDAADNTKVNRAGDTMTGPLIVPTPTAAGHAATKAYVDSQISGSLECRLGPTRQGNLGGVIGGNTLCSGMHGAGWKFATSDQVTRFYNDATNLGWVRTSSIMTGGIDCNYWSTASSGGFTGAVANGLRHNVLGCDQSVIIHCCRE